MKSGRNRAFYSLALLSGLAVLNGCASANTFLMRQQTAARYKDEMKVYSQERIDSASKRGAPDLIGTIRWDVLNYFVVPGCDSSKLAGLNLESPYYVRSLMRWLPDGFDVYDFDVFNLPVENLYNDQVENGRYSKIKRISAEAPLVFCTPLSDCAEITKLFNGLHKEAVDAGADAVTDLCIYKKDYVELAKNTLNTPSFTKTETLYRGTYFLTGTLIRYINGFVPDDKHLYRRAVVAGQ